MEKNTYIIWKHNRHGSISDSYDVVGLFVGTWYEADALVEKMNTEDETVIKKSLGGDYLYGYHKTEPPFVTESNTHEWYQN